MARTVACDLYEPDGTPLSAGTARLRPALAAWEAVVTALDRPGQVVQRCLLGGVQELHVRLDGAAPLTARVERVSYDPTLGRTCTLRLEPA